MFRIGQGFDVHKFSELSAPDGIMLGGVAVPADKRLLAHSDGDVVLHALCDALLGAAGLGDIGVHFSDQDPQFNGMASYHFVEHVMKLLGQAKLKPVNVDVTIIAERPRVAPYAAQMKQRISQLLAIAPDFVNIKATTTEQLGFIGRREGVAAQVVTLLTKQLD